MMLPRLVMILTRRWLALLPVAMVPKQQERNQLRLAIQLKRAMTVLLRSVMTLTHQALIQPL